jgi:hypothetical protein
MFIKQTLPKPKTSRTVLLTKTNTLGLFSLAIFPNKSRLVTIDTRLEEPAIRIYREPKTAQTVFKEQLEITLRNGWTIAYDGPPLHG